jgi:ubiquinone/menaquinone biosynthesis C-methylase UbiE
MTETSALGRFIGNLKYSRWCALRRIGRVYRAYAMFTQLEQPSGVGYDPAAGFNAQTRDAWVADRAKSVVSKSRVLDVGAGTAPYRDLFSHCDYETQDFSQYEGYKGPEGQYADINYVSDITGIPVPDASFDVILCTEVLEHVPRPVEALQEMVRVTKPGGRLFLTAPLGSGLHQEPYHFYGGYTDHWYRKFLTEFGCEIVSITPNHGFFAHLAQECARFAWIAGQQDVERGPYREEIQELIGQMLPRYLYELDTKIPLKEFTVGFHVEAKRCSANA